jgi:hypothetical protein
MGPDGGPDIFERTAAFGILLGRRPPRDRMRYDVPAGEQALADRKLDWRPDNRNIGEWVWRLQRIPDGVDEPLGSTRIGLSATAISAASLPASGRRSSSDFSSEVHRRDSGFISPPQPEQSRSNDRLDKTEVSLSIGADMCERGGPCFRAKGPCHRETGAMLCTCTASLNLAQQYVRSVRRKDAQLEPALAQRFH